MALTETDARLAIVEALARLILARLDFIELKTESTGETLMTTLAELQQKAADTLTQVKAEADVVAAVKLLVEHQNADLAALKQQVADLIAAGGADQTALQALSDTIDQIKQQDTANAAVVAQAVAAGTPASDQT